MEALRYKEIDYVIRRPENETEGKKYPLVIYLHGAGGRGRDISPLLGHSFFTHSEKYLTEAYSVSPQCYADSWFDIFEQLQDLSSTLSPTRRSTRHAFILWARVWEATERGRWQ